MPNNRYKNLAKNTLIFAVGSFGSKVLSFLIVPLYTYVLTKNDYGIIDLYTTSISLMIPFITIVIYEGIIRYLTTKQISDSQAVTSAFVIFVFGVALCVIGVPFYNIILRNSDYIYLFVITLIFNSYNQIFSHYLRASNNNIAFTINGIIVTGVTVSLNLLFLVFFKFGILGYLLSLLFAQIIASIQATIQGHIFKKIHIKCLNITILKMLVRYCIPLIPNGLMWWVMNAGDKYIINYYLGTESNGIYALSMKIPTIISMVYAIFMQAWQLSAIEEGGKHDSGVFYSKVFSTTTAFLAFISSIIIILIKPLFKLVINEEFVEAWKYVPFLCVAVLISCIATFSGVVYMVEEKSYKSFITTFIGAIGNIIFNFLLVRHYGLYGVAVGTAIGYFMVALIRMRDAKKMSNMSFEWGKLLGTLAILICQGICVIVLQSYVVYIVGILMLCILIFMYRKECSNIISLVERRIRNKQSR